MIGIGGPQKRCRDTSQSRSRKLTAPLPSPFASSQSMVTRLASPTPRPSSEISSLAELIAGPSPVKASPSQSSGGCTVRTMGRSNFVANSQSRWSWPGTAMIAPVP